MNNRLTILAVLLLAVLSMNVFAAGDTITPTITAEPSSVSHNANYAITYTVTDSANKTANVTTEFYVNGANVANDTKTNTSTTPGSNSYISTFSNSFYDSGDTIYANVTVKEYANASVTGATAASSIVVSSGALVSTDSFSFLGGIGSGIGSFITSLFNALLPIAVFLLVIGGVAAILYFIAKWSSDGFNSNVFGKKK